MHDAAKRDGREPQRTGPQATAANDAAPTRAPGSSSLRERAERSIREADAKREDQASRSAVQQLYELRLHQVELELQNEQLHETERDLELQNDRLRSLERELERSRADYRDLFDLAPLGYVTLDASGAIGCANQAAEVLLGEALVGGTRTLAEFTEGSDLRALRAHLHAAAHDTDSCELRLRRPDGSGAYARVESRPAPGGGCLTMLTDISDRKRAEDALSQTNRELVARTDELDARNAALGRAVAAREASEAERSTLAARLRDAERLESLGLLAGGIAHDFNNLLVGVMANADVLLETMPGLAEPARAGLLTIKRAARSAADLTRQLLVYAGRGQVTLRPVQLDRSIRECLQLLQARVPTGIELCAELAAEDRWINADVGQLQQVVGNLVTNGIEAIGASGGRVIVRTRLEQLDARALETFPHMSRATPGPFAVLEVEDTGMGIDAAHLSRIFEPFFTSKFTGRGLGLASVRGIVRSHDAALRVQSTPGQGSSFVIAWPLATPIVLSEAAEPRVTRHWQRTDQVLVVDDDPAVRRAMAQQLSHFGFSVIQAASGPEAVELFQAEPSRFRLAVIDQTMPDWSGDRVIERLHRLSPALPVVLVSGYSASAPAVDDDCVAFVAKPMTLCDLQQAISRLLDAGLDPGAHAARSSSSLSRGSS
jgi:PAS domain S-box-containing protein